MKRVIILVIFLLFALSYQPVVAKVQLSDSASVSLLTASPWYDAIYAFFGHTALRVHDDSTGVDAVFNYGYFDSTQPNFIYNFIRGKTDYVLGVITFDQFMYEYGFKGQEVVEQELNIMPNEKQELYDALVINSLPENMQYRYNYFYDNCATRIRDMVEKYIYGGIDYAVDSKEQSFRDLIHEHVSHSPWVKFGIDLLIGSDADNIIDVHEKMYIPSYLMDSFDNAIVKRKDTINMTLVKKSMVLLPRNLETNNPKKSSPITPVLFGLILLIITLLISLLQIIKLDKIKLPIIFDTLLFGAVGVSGFIVFILMYLSEHPATNPNWNFVWINPFAVIAAILFWFKRAEMIVRYYHIINFTILVIFMLLWWLIPQQMPLASIAFVLCLSLRSGTQLYMKRRYIIMEKRYASSRTLKRGWGI